MESLQVLRYVWLRGAQSLGDFSDTALALFEDLENAKAHGLTQHAETPSDKLDHSIG